MLRFWIVRSSNGEVTALRLGDDVRRSVIFFGLPNTKAEGESITYRGTGFFVFSNQPSPATYLVTCRHVAQNLSNGPFFLRANTTDGSVAEILVDSANWLHHWDESVDIAVTAYRWPDTLNCLAVPTDRCLTEDRRRDYGIGAGDIV
jgi:hypothetical protein